MNVCATTATPAVVTTTSPIAKTDRLRAGSQTRERREERGAVQKGGTPKNTSFGSRSTSGIPGTTPIARPPMTSRIGYGMRRAGAIASSVATARMSPRATIPSWTSRCMRQSCTRGRRRAPLLSRRAVTDAVRTFDTSIGTLGVESTATGLRRVCLPGGDARSETRAAMQAPRSSPSARSPSSTSISAASVRSSISSSTGRASSHASPRARDAPRDRPVRSDGDLRRTRAPRGRRRSAGRRRDDGAEPDSARRAVSPRRRGGRARRVRVGSSSSSASSSSRVSSASARPRPVTSVQGMELVQLGDSGLRASRIGLGCNNFGGRVDLEGTRRVVDAALDVGVTFFDTAEIYGNGGDSERFLGEVLAGRREQVVAQPSSGGGGTRETGLPSTSAGPSTDPSSDCKRTTSTSTTSTSPTRRRRSRRRSTRSTRSCGGEGARDRLFELLVRAARGSRSGRARARHHALHGSAERVQPARARGRRCGTAALSRARHRIHPHFPLASGLLTGKYRRGEPAPDGTRLAGREIADERFGGSRRALRSRRSADIRFTSSRSARWRRHPESARSSRVPRSPSRCVRTLPPRQPRGSCRATSSPRSPSLGDRLHRFLIGSLLLRRRTAAEAHRREEWR